MAKINYTISKKIKDDNSEIILDIQPQRGVHYRVKSGVFITPANYERLTAASKLLTYDRLYKIDKELNAAMPCDKETAEQIIARVNGADDTLLYVFSSYTDARLVEKGLTSGTKHVYANLKSTLRAYDEHATLRSIDSRWLAGLVIYMCEQGLTNRTQGTYYRILKTFLKHCVENEMVSADVLKFKPSFRVVENDVVSLSSEELQKMYSVKLESRSQNAIRDVFVVQCLTGLRYSDMCNIYKDNIQEDEGGKYITLVTKKTMKRIKIYFNSRAQHILELWDYNLPHHHITQVDIQLPKIAKKAGIVGRVEIVSMVGNKRVSEVKEKWEMIKTHTARRTFISLMLEAGESITTIRSITGHAQLSSFARYVAVSDAKKSSAVKGLDW